MKDSIKELMKGEAINFARWLSVYTIVTSVKGIQYNYKWNEYSVSDMGSK